MLVLIAAPALAADLPIRAMRWVASDSNQVRVLTRTPAECLTHSSVAIEIGRAAFRSPLLLGGQAARAGLSCDSCHRNGRGNPDFHFPGLSGAPGTADVTSSLFSRKRGDGTDNPKPIPDLAIAPHKVAARDLPTFITGQIVEEFDGAPPPPAVITGLAAYVAALQPSACPAGDTAVTATSTANDARRAVAAAKQSLIAGDPATAAAMILAARSQLGLLDERFPAARPRAALRAADADLAAVLAKIRANDPRATKSLQQWQDNAPNWQRLIAATEAQSLFNPARLAAALPATTPPHPGTTPALAPDSRTETPPPSASGSLPTPR
nr:hypothetical protein [Polymorphobacter sp.]